ncbi:hypothetical protein NP233_g8143 [Leucocoprinus birnbaumii]|uniref:Yeast cell wall synthesis Kre9/Knh1-like N-terminal domain-containing protein n=1 Tax=Leucocoprinus birnbaumii TaxID=56174 RepID=A0AAD5VMV9_9AGAR|nr:hypothetical protein NP233_g8143 [Leucocoprinus birnbaumii]
MQLALYSALFLSLASSSLAYLVNFPNGNNNENWHGKYKSQRVSWSRVDTDAKDFAVVLTRNGLNIDTLAWNVNGGSDGGSTWVRPPHGGFPVGEHYRVNLVKSANEPNTIYAQSNEFTIYAFAFSTTLLLSLVSSSLAYLVTAPNGDANKNWNGASSPQTVSWTRVDTDAATFNIVLTNVDRAILPSDQVLAKQVNGQKLQTKVFPPRGGFPTGSHFRINLVSTQDGSIYAQSNEFTISH